MRFCAIIFLMAFSNILTQPKELQVTIKQITPFFEELISFDDTIGSSRVKNNGMDKDFYDQSLIKIICRNSEILQKMLVNQLKDDEHSNCVFEKMENGSTYLMLIEKIKGNTSVLITNQDNIFVKIVRDELDVNHLFQNIDHKSDILIALRNSGELSEEVKEYIYHLLIYHTIGLSNNTITIEQLRYILKTRRAVYGKSIKEHNEVLGIELAMKYVKTLSSVEKIGLNEILGIHKRVMGYVDPLTAGTFRAAQLVDDEDIPSFPNEVEELMAEFTNWLNSKKVRKMHPVKYAAFAHMKLFRIHPFDDGNGRTSRLLMNLILLRAGLPPIIIFKYHQAQYYDYMKSDTFVEFIARSMDNVLDFYLCSAHKVLL